MQHFSVKPEKNQHLHFLQKRILGDQVSRMEQARRSSKRRDFSEDFMAPAGQYGALPSNIFNFHPDSGSNYKGIGDGILQDAEATERSLGTDSESCFRQSLTRSQNKSVRSFNHLKQRAAQFIRKKEHSLAGSRHRLQARAPINIEIKNNNRKKAITILEQRIVPDFKNQSKPQQQGPTTTSHDDRKTQSKSGRRPRDLRLHVAQADQSTVYSGMTNPFGEGNFVEFNSNNQTDKPSPGMEEPSPATATSQPQSGVSKRLRRKKRKPQQHPKHGSKAPCKDTNVIYPPDRAYERANQEMKSPTKKRPLSGGPSPDKKKLEVPKFDGIFRMPNHRQERERQNEEKMEQARKIFNDHKETQMLLKKATAGLQQTRKTITQSIVSSQNTINEYNRMIEEHKQNLEKKVDEKLKIAYKIVKDDPKASESDQPGKERRTMQSVERYLRKKDQKVEYKYAFGQRIPVDHEWKVEQPNKPKEVANKEANPKPEKSQPRPQFEIVYDYHGRPHRQKIEYTASGSEKSSDESELADFVDEFKSQEKQNLELAQDEGDKSEARGEGKMTEEEKTKLPAWITNPFYSIENSDTEEEELQQEKRAPSALNGSQVKGRRLSALKDEEKLASAAKAAPRKQRDIMIRSKSRGAQSNEGGRRMPVKTKSSQHISLTSKREASTESRGGPKAAGIRSKSNQSAMQGQNSSSNIRMYGNQGRKVKPSQVQDGETKEKALNQPAILPQQPKKASNLDLIMASAFKTPPEEQIKEPLQKSANGQKETSDYPLVDQLSFGKDHLEIKDSEPVEPFKSFSHQKPTILSSAYDQRSSTIVQEYNLSMFGKFLEQKNFDLNEAFGAEIQPQIISKKNGEVTVPKDSSSKTKQMIQHMSGHPSLDASIGEVQQRPMTSGQRHAYLGSPSKQQRPKSITSQPSGATPGLSKTPSVAKTGGPKRVQFLDNQVSSIFGQPKATFQVSQPSALAPSEKKKSDRAVNGQSSTKKPLQYRAPNLGKPCLEQRTSLDTIGVESSKVAHNRA